MHRSKTPPLFPSSSASPLSFSELLALTSSSEAIPLSSPSYDDEDEDTGSKTNKKSAKKAAASSSSSAEELKQGFQFNFEERMNQMHIAQGEWKGRLAGTYTFSSISSLTFLLSVSMTHPNGEVEVGKGREGGKRQTVWAGRDHCCHSPLVDPHLHRVQSEQPIIFAEARSDDWACHPHVW
jgi:hypothetical protein